MWQRWASAWFKAAFYLWASASPFFSKCLFLGLDRGPGTLKFPILGRELEFETSRPAIFNRAAMGFGLVQGCFLSLGRPLPTFQQDGHFSLKSRSWNPEVNSFGFKSRLFWAVSWNLGSFCPQARFGGLRAGISAILGREQLISAFSAVAT